MGGVFLVYPTICNTLFATFECRTLTTAQDSLSEGVLEQDDRLLCSAGVMASLRWLSAVAIVCFALGVPLTFAVVLRRAARVYDTSEQRQLDRAVAARLADEIQIPVSAAEFIIRDVTALGEKYGFLLDAFHFRHYYWETLDMLRKLLLVGLVLLVGRGSPTQAFVALVLSFGFFALHTATRPYKIAADNAFRAGTEVHIFLMIATSLVLRGLEDGAAEVAAYDWTLFGSFVVLLPCGFVLTVAAKLRGADQTLSDTTLDGAFARMRFGLATDGDRAAIAGRIAAIRAAVRASSDTHKRIVVSCPVMSTLDGAGGPPYDQDAMGKVRELQQLGVVKVGYDRPGSTTARAEDVELFASGDPEKIKLTMWFYGYATAMKRCIAIESQNFDGLLELICIHGGPITTVEAQEMPRILADAAHDASMGGAEIGCEFKISAMSYVEFVRRFDDSGSAGGGSAADSVAMLSPARALPAPQLQPEPEPEPEPQPERPLLQVALPGQQQGEAESQLKGLIALLELDESQERSLSLIHI